MNVFQNFSMGPQGTTFTRGNALTGQMTSYTRGLDGSMSVFSSDSVTPFERMTGNYSNPLEEMMNGGGFGNWFNDPFAGMMDSFMNGPMGRFFNNGFGGWHRPHFGRHHGRHHGWHRRHHNHHKLNSQEKYASNLENVKNTYGFIKDVAKDILTPSIAPGVPGAPKLPILGDLGSKFLSFLG